MLLPYSTIMTSTSCHRFMFNEFMYATTYVHPQRCNHSSPDASSNVRTLYAMYLQPSNMTFDIHLSLHMCICKYIIRAFVAGIRRSRGRRSVQGWFWEGRGGGLVWGKVTRARGIETRAFPCEMCACSELLSQSHQIIECQPETRSRHEWKARARARRHYVK